MESRPTPFPVAGKSQSLNQKPSRKPSESWKPSGRGPSFTRQKRVFGTAQNPNIPSNTIHEKPRKKSPPGMQGKAGKTIQSPPPALPVPEAKKSSENKGTRPSKKIVCFQEKDRGNSSQNGRFSEPQTPVNSSSIASKPRRSGTPYHSAQKCSKCRFDRFENSAYWFNQIKMAETVGKHFLSAAFFRLAYESKADPLLNLKLELKKYLGRHHYLNMEDDWMNLSISYGLVKEENKISEEKDAVRADEDTPSIPEEDKDLIKEISEAIDGTESLKFS